MKAAYTWVRSHAVTLACVFIILLIAFSLFSLEWMFRQTMNAVDLQTASLSSVQLGQTRSELDIMLRSMSDLVSQISANVNVVQFASVGRPAKADDHYKLYELIRSFSPHRNQLSGNSLFQDFVVYYPADDMLVSSSAYYHTRDFYTRTYSDGGPDYETWLSLISSQYSGCFVSAADSSNCIAYIQSLDLAKMPSANVILFINRQQLQNYISLLEQESCHIFMLSQGTLLHADTAEEALVQEMYAYLLNPSGYTGSLSIERLASSIFRDTAFYVASRQDVSASHPQHVLKRFYSVSVTIALIIIISALAVLLMWILPPTIRMAANLRKAHSKTEIKSFGLLNQAVEQVLSRGRIGDSMVDQWPVLKDALLDRLTRSSAPQDGLLRSLSVYNIEFNYPYFIAALFSFEQPVNHSVFQQMTRAFTDVCPSTVASTCFPLGEKTLVVLFNLTDPDFSCRDLVEWIRSDLCDRTQAPVIACIGSLQEGVNGIRQSYSDAVKLIDYTVFTGTDATIEFSMCLRGESKYYYPMDFELSLIAAVRAGNYQRVSELLEQIHEENFVKRQLRPDIARLLLSELTGTALKILDDSESSAAENILRCRTAEDIFRALREIYMTACKTELEQPATDRRREMEEYILAHYTDPNFSQVRMSEDLNLSPNYLSSQFKAHFNTTMVSYVTSLRVRHAADLLTTTEVPISEIAGLCGFGSSDALSRAFKREYGVTPGSYRSGARRT